MKFAKFAAAAAAVSLATAPAMAVPVTERASAPAAQESHTAVRPVFSCFRAAALVIGVASGGDDNPTSP